MFLRDAARLPSLLPGGARDGARSLRLGQHGRAAGPPRPTPSRKVEGNRAIWIALAATLTLAGCVGSDDNPPDIAETHPSVVVRLDPGSFQHAVSAYRQAHGLSPVAIDPGLMALAQSQANVMARSNHLSHEIAGSLDQRLNAAHHTKGYAVENVSAGYATADAALVGWEHSPGHNLNLLDKKMRRLGIAAADAPGTRFKTYWALMMTD